MYYLANQLNERYTNECNKFLQLVESYNMKKRINFHEIFKKTNNQLSTLNETNEKRMNK